MKRDANLCQISTSPNQRLLNLLAVPSKTEIASIEFDLTLDCNLRCRYCYKGENREVYMPRRVAFDAVIWLIHASGNQKQLGVFFLGGEPMMHFSLIKELVPFGIRRAKQHGKVLTFSMTTNGTMITDEVVEFFRKWGVTFHTSIDGVPDIQDKNRPTATGGPSSPLVERAVPKILAYRPETSARCTFDGENVHRVFENYEYFRSLGYTSVIMIPIFTTKNWTSVAFQVLEQQYDLIADRWINEIRQGTFVFFKHFDDYFNNRQKTKRGTVPCGSGRAYGVITPHGDYFPCSRWAIHKKEEWSFGNIYESFREEARVELLKGFPEDSFMPECEECPARCVCNGGCLAENLDAMGSPFRVIPESCEIMRIWVRVGQRVYDTLYQEKNPTFMQKYCPQEWQNGGSACSCRQKDGEEMSPASQDPCEGS